MDNEKQELKLTLLTLDSIDEIVNFYDDVITKTKNVEKYCRWCQGKYPIEEDFIKYIKMNAMYGLRNEQALIGSFALTLGQNDDYHQIPWIFDVDEEEVAVLHILATHPAYQKQGLGKKLVFLAIDLAKQKGCNVLRLDALATNLPARRLYEYMGFEYRGSLDLYTDNT